MKLEEFIQELREFDKDRIEALEGSESYDWSDNISIKKLGKQKRYSFEELDELEWKPCRSYEKYEVEKECIYVQWEVGGVSGGNCWVSSNPRAYTTNKDKPEFEFLDAILEKYIPDITYLEYKKLVKQVIKEGEWTEIEYYGNNTEYRYMLIEFEDLYNYFVEKQWLKF